MLNKSKTFDMEAFLSHYVKFIHRYFMINEVSNEYWTEIGYERNRGSECDLI